MYRFLLWIPILVLLGTGYTYGQAGAFKVKGSIDTASVKAGRYLDRAKMCSVQEFVKMYIAVGDTVRSRKWGYTHLEKLYQDATFAYYGQVKSGGLLMTFFKVPASDLSGLDYKTLDYQTLTKKFMEEIFPADDRKLLGRKKGLNNCWTANEMFDFIYHPDKKQLEVAYHWTVDCNYRSKKIRKHYTALYDPASKQFVK
ncbi:hypothetical protein HF329_11260 [Chitinophaga oryzae]|uniref:Uncharacterized protein n=1 Tax=Chitinophaga oryzae TaxID=2725414 RepID=A0AAE6ZFR0_9BACT|nr:hypothetical protein [Chitinophaga oryzae]QJB31871.1 hypothetical protein HF329_11260 [Chitinophaga oryzae]